MTKVYTVKIGIEGQDDQIHGPFISKDIADQVLAAKTKGGKDSIEESEVEIAKVIDPSKRMEMLNATLVKN